MKTPQTGDKSAIVRDKLKKVLTNDQIKAYQEDSYYLVDLGFDLIDANEFRKAYDILLLDVSENGFCPDSINGLGIALCELGRIDTALQLMQHAAELYPDDAVTIANLAGVFWEKADFGHAIQQYTKALSLNPDLLDSYFNLANVYYESGNIHLAFMTSNTMLQRFPDEPEAKSFHDDLLIDIALTLN